MNIGVLLEHDLGRFWCSRGPGTNKKKGIDKTVLRLDSVFVSNLANC